MPTNALDFANELKFKAGRMTANAIGPTIKRVARDLLTSIVRSTPVKTGRAKGNWQVGINGSNSYETGILDPSGEGTINRGLATIEGARPFSDIHIFNNAPYIWILENGASLQAPANTMVQANLARVAFEIGAAAR